MPEIPQRIQKVHENLIENGLYQKCTPLDIIPADPEMVKLVHSETLVERCIDLAMDWKDMMNPKPREKGSKRSFGIMDLYDNEHTSSCIFKSCGGAIQAVQGVINDQVNSSFANIRPPGHHSSINQPNGFCYINNIAVAARYAQQQPGINKVLIFDWDVHHGNGTQDIFENDDSVMFLSTHRYDNGNYYPNLPEKSSWEFQASADCRPFSYNIAWNTEEEDDQSMIGDSDYRYAFDNIVFPIAEQFKPDLVLVSAGFDAMRNDPLGMLSNSPAIYAYMTSKLMQLAQQVLNRGKVVCALEGGYNLNNLQDATTAIINTLLGESRPCEGIDLENLDQFAAEPSELGRQAADLTLGLASEHWELGQIINMRITVEKVLERQWSQFKLPSVLVYTLYDQQYRQSVLRDLVLERSQPILRCQEKQESLDFVKGYYKRNVIYRAWFDGLATGLAIQAFSLWKWEKFNFIGLAAIPAVALIRIPMLFKEESMNMCKKLKKSGVI